MSLSLRILAGLALAAPAAQAATRTVCFDLKIADERVDCADMSEPGARRGCDNGAHIWAVGHVYEAWDKDDDGNDEHIGTYAISGEGTRCITFEWEGAGYSKGESNPDVYLKYINRVRKTSVTGARVDGVKTDGSAAVVTSWRDVSVASNCAAGATCYINPAGYLIPTTDAFSLRGGRIMALDSAQHSLEVYADLMDLNINLHYPGDGTNSFARSQTEFHIAETQEDSGMTATHEMGHVLQMQLFGQDDLRDDCGTSHGLTTVETQSCATTEGWAGYAGAVAWWDPNHAASVPVWWGKTFEDATPYGATAADNAGIEMQVARAFWDLDDTDNTDLGTGLGLGDDDLLAYASDYIAEGWQEFPNGTGNHDDFESNGDGDAVNVRDYCHNNAARFAAGLEETVVRHNVLDSQVTD